MPPIERRPMRPADIERVVVVEELDLAPDGSFTVVVRRVVRRHRYESHLFRIDLHRRSRPRRLTDGVVRDAVPRISPDGRSVAFVRSAADRDSAPSEVWTVSTDPSRAPRPRRLLPRRGPRDFGAIGELAWAPDGRALAFSAEADPPISIVGRIAAVGSGAESDPATPTPTARRITRADWRWDEMGHRDRWNHLFVWSLDASSDVRQVTSGAWGVSGITWHPDGRTVAFAADRSADADVDPHERIWSIDVVAAGSEPTCLVDAPGGARHPAFSPDGRWLAAVGVVDADPLDDVSPGLLLSPADGSAPARALAPELDRPIGNWCDTDLHGWMVSGRHGPCWLDDETIVAAVTDRGRSLPEVWRIDPDSGELRSRPVASDRDAPGPWADATTHSLAVRPAMQEAPAVVAVLGTMGSRAMDVMTVDLDQSAGQRSFRHHGDLGSAWQRRFVMPDMHRIDVDGPGGPIETWIASPPGAGDGALATIVDVHGGPLGGWAPAPHMEVIQLVGAGYRVVLPNVRGGAGYGSSWIRPQLGDWGGVDAVDVHAVVDHVVSAGLADPDRLGIMGLSYGGFMVNWMVGTSRRFRAAVSENGVTNQVSCWANSDCGPAYSRTSLLGDPFTEEGVASLWRQSPLRHVASVETPLLMLQAESDLRCPPQDNEQFFVALRHLRRRVEYVLYPESFHTFSSSGRPDRRIDRMERVLAWFEEHLRPV